MKLLTVVAVFLLAGLAAAPSQCLAGAREGLNLCANIIIPSLFPFFVCSKLLIITGAAEKIGKWCQIIMRPLFNVPGCASVALVLGLLSGYPVGARCGVDLYEKKLCTKSEAQRIVCFCNNCGPLFIIGSVGVGMMHSYLAGILLYAIHIISALTVGFIFRFYKKNERMTLPCASYRLEKSKSDSIGSALSESVSKSVELLLYVCGFIVFFGAFTVMLDRFGIIALLEHLLGLTGISPNASRALAFGFFEITNGALRVASLPAGHFRIVLESMLLAWSGLCVILQVCGIISKSSLSAPVFIGAKALHLAIAGIYAMLLIRLPVGSVQTFAGKSPAPADAWVYSLILLCISISIILMLCIFCLAYRKLKR